jgi:hypothetical protein
LGRVSPRAALTRRLIASGRTGLSGCSAIHASMARNNSCENAALICAASDFSSGRFGGVRDRASQLYFSRAIQSQATDQALISSYAPSDEFSCDYASALTRP